MVRRELASQLSLRASHATVLTGVRRSGKSTLQLQLRARRGPTRDLVYCNFEDIRLFGLGREDFPTLVSLFNEMSPLPAPVLLDEVQAVEGWQHLVRALVDGGRPVCLTGSNASLLGSDLGTKLTGRHLSYEVFPFSYAEFLSCTRARPGRRSMLEYLDAGGFPAYVRDRDNLLLQELVRDVIQRDVAARHRLRDTRHLMNLLLFLIANTGQPFSFQRLTKRLGVPTVAQTSRYVDYLVDAYLLFVVPKFSTSIADRVVAPAKYYAIDNGLRRALSAQPQADLGHCLENAVGLHLRRRGEGPRYAGARDTWECDFVTEDEAIQVTLDLTPMNRPREVRGLIEAARMAGVRRATILTLDQTDRLREEGMTIEVLPAWRWMAP
jgi:uncharacterized protein